MRREEYLFSPTDVALSVIPEVIKNYGKLQLAGSLGGIWCQSSYPPQMYK